MTELLLYTAHVTTPMLTALNKMESDVSQLLKLKD